MFFLVGSGVVGYLTIRARVFPAVVGWLLIVGGVLNLVSGLIPAGLVATILGDISVLAIRQPLQAMVGLSSADLYNGKRLLFQSLTNPLLDPNESKRESACALL